MSLSQKNLSSIQKAGQAAHSAAQAVAATVQAQAQSMVASVATQPFGSESEHALDRFKMLARLNQGLASVEGQLRELFAIATELAGPASDVVIALPYAAKLDSSDTVAVDVIAKPSKAAKSAKKKLKSKLVSKRMAASSGALTANDTALLQYLQSVLKTGEEARLTGGAMAAGSGLPLGSIGVSLKKILSYGAVTSRARGQYQLGGTSEAAAPAPEAKRKPAKKAKVTSAKKAKSAAQSQDSVAATEEAAS
jgi:hypothetical protein